MDLKKMKIGENKVVANDDGYRLAFQAAVEKAATSKDQKVSHSFLVGLAAGHKLKIK